MMPTLQVRAIASLTALSDPLPTLARLALFRRRPTSEEVSPASHVLQAAFITHVTRESHRAGLELAAEYFDVKDGKYLKVP